MSPRTLIAFFITINVVAYLIMHVDKNNSRCGRKRISEASLLTMAAIGGSIGILVSMRVLRHKTRKKAFTFGVPIILVLQILLLVFLSR